MGAHERIGALRDFEDDAGKPAAGGAALRLTLVAAPGALSAFRRVAADANPRMDRKLHLLRQADEVNILIAPGAARVLSEEREHLQRIFENASGEDRVIQFLRRVGRAEFGELLRIARRVEGAHRRVVDRDVVGMPIAADRVEGDHHLRLQVAEDFDDFGCHFLQRRGGERVGMRVVRRAGHPGVAVAQINQVGQLQLFRGAGQFGPAHVG